MSECQQHVSVEYWVPLYLTFHKKIQYHRELHLQLLCKDTCVKLRTFLGCFWVSPRLQNFRNNIKYTIASFLFKNVLKCNLLLWSKLHFLREREKKWSKVTLKIFLMLHKISISNKCFSFNFVFIKNPERKCNMVSTKNIKQHKLFSALMIIKKKTISLIIELTNNNWAANQHTLKSGVMMLNIYPNRKHSFNKKLWYLINI